MLYFWSVISLSTCGLFCFYREYLAPPCQGTTNLNELICIIQAGAFVQVTGSSELITESTLFNWHFTF